MEYIQANDIIAIIGNRDVKAIKVTAVIPFESGSHILPIMKDENGIYLCNYHFNERPLCRVIDYGQLFYPDTFTSKGEIVKSYGYCRSDDEEKRAEQLRFIVKNHLMDKNDLVRYLFKIFYRAKDKEKKDDIKKDINYVRSLR